MVKSSKSWMAVGESVLGMGHARSGKPCQDANRYVEIGGSVFIGVVCDGAGSKTNSHIGSAFIANKAIEKLTSYVEKNYLAFEINPPSPKMWFDSTLKILRELILDLIVFSFQKDKEYTELACTIITAIVFPDFILVFHIGDGRGAYRLLNGEWLPFMKPMKGEYASETVFITSPIWENLTRYIETRVILDRATAISILSDGCERSSFLCNQKKEENLYFDPNIPFKPFFESNINTLLNLKLDGFQTDRINELWKLYLKEGTETLRLENDDKTMILAVKE